MIQATFKNNIFERVFICGFKVIKKRHDEHSAGVINEYESYDDCLREYEHRSENEEWIVYFLGYVFQAHLFFISIIFFAK